LISLNPQSDTLRVANLAETKITPETITELCNAIKENIGTTISKINFDLKGIKSSNYNVLIFVKAVAEMSSEANHAFTFENADDKTLDSLGKLGFKEGKYEKKEFRKEEIKSTFETTGGAIFKIFSDCKKLLIYTGELIKTSLYFLRHPHKLDWKETLYYADKTGADAVPIVMLICFLMGVILAFQGLAQLSRFGLSIFVSDLVGLSIVRELGPLMVAIICTGRAGSAFAAELGTMKVNEEIDALTTMGIKPMSLLIMPKLLGLLIVMPMLTIIGDVVGVIGGGLITALSSNISFYEYMNRVIQAMIPANVFESLTKSVVFAFLVAAIGCFRGLEAENDAKGVGNATTSSVVSGIFLIILADTALTFIYPQVMLLFGIVY
jgi:phospholipid/cholesterol/gamma-HCH transport system permease protein